MPSPLQRPARILALFAAALPAAVLSGCGNNPYPAREQREALYYTYLTDDPKTLDPTVVYNVTDGEIAGALYVSYFQYHFLKRSPFELQLALGAEMPVREPHVYRTTGSNPKRVRGERWTFRIKRGLRFQDDPCFPGGKGREIVAADFVHAFKRMADPELSCPILSFVVDKIEGLDAFHQRQRARLDAGSRMDYDAVVPGLQTDPNDPYVFRIVLNQPYPQLRYLMAMAFTSPLAPEATRRYGKELSRHPVGNGPYVLAEWLPRQRLVLRRNPNYRRDDLFPADAGEGIPAEAVRDAGRALPLNVGVVFSVIRERITAWNFFQQGYLDAFGVTQENFSQAVSQVGTLTPTMAEKGISLSRSTSPMIYYYAFNMKDPVVGGYGERQKKLRQALSLCYDADSEINLVNAGLGRAGQFLIPPGVDGYDPDYRSPYGRPDLERARQLLAEAGYPGGVDAKTGERLEILWDNQATSAVGRQQVGLLQKRFNQIGVRLTSRTWRREVWNDRLDKGQFQFTDYGWVADYPDPENFVFLLYGPNERPGPNLTAYSRPEYDRLFEQMRAMDDGPQRRAIIRRLREMAVEDCPYIYRFHDEDLKLANTWVRNAESHPIALDVLKYRAVDAELRAGMREQWNRPNVWPLLAAGLFAVLASIPAVAAARRRGRMTARRRAQQ